MTQTPDTAAAPAFEAENAVAFVVPTELAGDPVTLTYRNWRGEVADRTIRPLRVWFGSTDWHPEPQWLLTALDVEKGAERDFALKDFGAAAPAGDLISREAIQTAIDLLAERTSGSPARSPGHNARLVLEDALRALPAASYFPTETEGALIRIREIMAGEGCSAEAVMQMEAILIAIPAAPEAGEVELGSLQAELTEMTRRRDEWRKKAEGYDALAAAVRAGTKEAGERNLSRVFMRGALVEATARAEAAEARLAEVEAERDAALVRLENLRAAIVAKGGNEHYPTEDAYLAACRAVDKHRTRANVAEAALVAQGELVAGAPDRIWVSPAYGQNWDRADAGKRAFTADVEYVRADLAAPASAGVTVKPRPMSEAPKDRTPILSRIRADLAEFHPHYGCGNAEAYAGRFVVISHPGLAPDGFDMGWSLAGPFGQGLGDDKYFEGWWPMPHFSQPAPVSGPEMSVHAGQRGEVGE